MNERSRARRLALALGALAALGGCGELVGLGGEVPPLAELHVEVTGDLASVRQAGTEDETPHLKVALVWAAQWLPEPFCVLPPESGDAAAVIEAGCPDSFGFVPARVGANADVEPGVPTTLALTSLPAADVMIGDLTARIAYASLVVYDDRNGTGTLDLQETRRFGDRGDRGPGSGGGGPGSGGPGGPEGGAPAPDADVIYGASLVSMTAPDQRVAFREGVFNRAAAFYPREGCPDPPRGFSILSAGGFSAADAVAAVLRGELPREDPARCAEEPLDAATVTVALAAPEPLRQLACLPRGDSSPRYRDTLSETPDLTDRAWACVGLPSFGEPVADDVVQLVAAGRPTDACRSLTHWLLRGCEHDASCETPEFDQTATPPDWWPCGSTP